MAVVRARAFARGSGVRTRNALSIVSVCDKRTKQRRIRSRRRRGTSVRYGRHGIKQNRYARCVPKQHFDARQCRPRSTLKEASSGYRNIYDFACPVVIMHWQHLECCSKLTEATLRNAAALLASHQGTKPSTSAQTPLSRNIGMDLDGRSGLAM